MVKKKSPYNLEIHIEDFTDFTNAMICQNNVGKCKWIEVWVEQDWHELIFEAER